MSDELLTIKVPVNYKNLQSPINLFFPLINFMGKDLIGAQLSVWQGEDLLALSHNCDNIKQIYGIDNHKPFRKSLFNTEELIDSRISSICEFYTKNNIEYSAKDNIILIEKSFEEASNDFKNNSLDFILMTIKTNKDDFDLAFKAWFDKVKPGGYFLGCNYDSEIVQAMLSDLYTKYDISELFSYGNLWIYKKNDN